METAYSYTLRPPPGPYRGSSARTSTTQVDMDTQEPNADHQPPQESAPEPELEPKTPEPELVPQTPQTALTFLLVDGRRRTMPFDPATTVARVKELVWSAWPSDAAWQDDRPPAPSYLRILYLGKILQDDDTLAHLGFPSYTPPSTASGSEAPAPPPTIVHLSVRAYAPPADDALKKKKSTRRRPTTDAAGNPVPPPPAGEDDAGGCCCVVC